MPHIRTSSTAPTSTFIVECSEATWRAAKLDAMSESQTCGWLEEVFREALEGERLLTKNFVKWLNFPLVRNANAGTVTTSCCSEMRCTRRISRSVRGRSSRSRMRSSSPRPSHARAHRARRCRCSRRCGGREWSSTSRRRLDSLRWFEDMARLHPPRPAAVCRGSHDAQQACRLREAEAAGPRLRRAGYCGGSLPDRGSVNSKLQTSNSRES